jgi:hypothetical protein
MNRDVCEHFTPTGLPCEKCSEARPADGMTKQEALRLLRLLSGLESAMLCNKQSLPDYLLDELLACADILEREVLK